MLPKNQRLNLSTDFKSVASGKRVQTKNFKLMFKFVEDEQPKVGIALAKSAFKKAHDRNQARRITSKVFESNYPNLKRGLNLVIMPKASLLTEEQANLQKEIRSVKEIFE